MKDINLLPSFIEKKDDELKWIRTVFIVLLVLSLGTNFSIAYYLDESISEKDNAISKVNAKIEELVVVEDLEVEINIQSLAFRSTMEVVNQFERDSIINYRLLQEISRTLPEDVFLLEYSVSEEKSIDLEGISKSEKDAIYLLSKLKTLNSVKLVKFNSMSKSRDKKSYYTFSITVDLN